MDDSSSTTANVDQADEQMLVYTISDEALEAAAGSELVATIPTLGMTYHCCTVS
jgi:hypothetical protein